jgi:hypothetical protein
MFSSAWFIPEKTSPDSCFAFAGSLDVRRSEIVFQMAIARGGACALARDSSNSARHHY